MNQDKTYTMGVAQYVPNAAEHIAWQSQSLASMHRQYRLIVRDVQAQQNANRIKKRKLQALRRAWKRVDKWYHMPDAELRLRCGELTAQEIRTVRAVLRAILEQ